MTKRLIIIAAFATGIQFFQPHALLAQPSIPAPVQRTSEITVDEAYALSRSDVHLEGSGIVTRILPDDINGSRHQRFILRLASGRSLLIAHNINLAPRVENLKQGDSVTFSGEYEWNAKGGIIHWTHRDPTGRHVGGWLKHQDRMYQ